MKPDATGSVEPYTASPFAVHGYVIGRVTVHGMAKQKTMSDPLTIRLPIDVYEVLVRNAERWARTPREHVRVTIETALRAQLEREAKDPQPKGTPE